MKPSLFNRVLAFSLLVAASSAHADTITKAAAGDDLATGTNWIGDSAPTSTDVATWLLDTDLDTEGNQSSLGGALTVGSVVNWGGINITGATENIAITGSQITTGNITLAGGQTLSIANNIALSGSSIFNIADVTGSTASDATLSGIISGTGFGITKSGAGTLTLNGINTYSGGTILNGGTLAVGAAGNLGNNANTITVGAGSSATLDLLGTVLRTINSGTITLNEGSQLTIARSEFTSTSLHSATFTGALSGDGSLVIGSIPDTISNSARRTVFNNASSYDDFRGDITVQSGANLAFTIGGTLREANSNNLNIAAGGYVTILGSNTPAEAPNIITYVGELSGAGTIARNTGPSSTATLSVASGNFSGVISQTALQGQGAIALVKTRSGTLTLSGSSNYSGGTTINGGILSGTHTNAFGTGAVTLDSGTLRTSVTVANALSVAEGKTGVLDVNTSGASTVGTGAAAVNGTLTVTRATAASAGTLILNTVFTGSGTVQIGNTIGGTTVGVSPNQGRLQAHANAFTNFTGDIRVLGTNGGGNLAFHGGLSTTTQKLTIDAGGYVSLTSSGGAGVTTTFGGLNGGGSITTNGPGSASFSTLSIGNGGANGDFGGVISQSLLNASNVTLSVVKNGIGTQILSGLASTYTGITAINGGTLEVAKVANGGSSSSIGQAAVAATNLVINGGSLKFSGTTGNGNTNRLFTIGVNGATIDASSTNNTALTFTNTDSLATTAGDTDRTLTLTGTTNAATLNSLASVIVDPSGDGKTNVTKSGGNTWVLSATNTYSGVTTIEQGTLKLTSSGSIHNSSSLVLGTSGGLVGTLDVTEKVSDFELDDVSGNGTIDIGGSKEIYIYTTLDPGFSAGRIDVIGNLTLDAGASTTMELAGSGGAPGEDFDHVYVSGIFTLAGILNIESYDGFSLTQAGVYSLFDAAGFDGTFESVFVGEQLLSQDDDVWSYNDGGLGYEFNQATGVLTVIPEPTAALLGGLGMLALLRRRRA